jgi:hypothetical protein
MAGTVAFRLKAKFADGRDQVSKRGGNEYVGAHRDIATVWEDDQGRTNVRFEPEFETALRKVLGAGSDDKVFFDLFKNDRGARQAAPKAKAKASRSPSRQAADDDESDDDLGF